MNLHQNFVTSPNRVETLSSSTICGVLILFGFIAGFLWL